MWDKRLKGEVGEPGGIKIVMMEYLDDAVGRERVYWREDMSSIRVPRHRYRSAGTGPRRQRESRPSTGATKAMQGRPMLATGRLPPRRASTEEGGGDYDILAPSGKWLWPLVS